MNERINELIEECTSVNDDLVYDGRDSYMKTTEYFDKEKFAELIVRECALVVHKKTGPKSALNVLEHFGVEE